MKLRFIIHTESKKADGTKFSLHPSAFILVTQIDNLRYIAISGEGGIRTHDGGTIPAFQASALDQLCDLSSCAKPFGYFRDYTMRVP